jgi:phosphoglycolate phosphatase
MATYEAVLFDQDGVLVDPPARERQAEATRAAFQAVGVSDPEARDPTAVTDLVEGVTVDRLHEIAAAFDLDPATLWTAREHHDEQSQFADFRRGAREAFDDVDVLRDLDLPCGVVSNNHHSTVGFVLEHVGLDPAVDTFYGREKTIDSLDRKKPAPHYLERALEDLDARSALYVGDRESDLVAARRAGIDSVLLRRQGRPDDQLATRPTHEVASLDAVPGLLDG